MTKTAEKSPPLIAHDSTIPAGLGSGEKLARRKSELSSTIEQQHILRAAATLEEKVFDPSTLKSAEDGLAAIEDAEAELVRRTRSVAVSQADTERKTQAERADKLLKEWLATIEDQEAAARSMVDAVCKAESQRDELQQHVFALSGSVPVLLMACEQEVRRSRGLAALLHKALKRSNFGEMKLRFGQARPDDQWSEAERVLAEEIQRQINEVLA